MFYFLTASKPTEPECDFSPFIIIFLSFVLALIYSVLLIIKSIIAKEPDRSDYFIFLGIINLPLVLGGLYLLSAV